MGCGRFVSDIPRLNRLVAVYLFGSAFLLMDGVGVGSGIRQR